jgi:hypothetical protein
MANPVKNHTTKCRLHPHSCLNTIAFSLFSPLSKPWQGLTLQLPSASQKIHFLNPVSDGLRFQLARNGINFDII